MPRTFQEFCKQFSDDEKRDKELVHVVKIGRRYFYDPLGLLKKAQEWEVFSVGLYLGEERREFQPTSALIDLLSARSEARVIVGSKAAYLFLCGRDILMDGVLDPGEFEHNELVFIADEHHETLGFGKIVSHYDRKMRNKTYVKHILDKGEYLRRER
jgi:ribosome biogenesis protein Nip4